MAIHEHRLKILQALYSRYPNTVEYEDLKRLVLIDPDELVRALFYLHEKELVHLDASHVSGQELPIVFHATLTADGVDLTETPSFLEYVRAELAAGQSLPPDRKEQVLEYVKKLGIPILVEIVKILLGR